MSPSDKPLVWLRERVKTPPFGAEARVEAGFLLRRLQRGDILSMPFSQPMPDIGPSCHELRVPDGHSDWRLMYHLAPDAIIVLDVFSKKTAATPRRVIAVCKARLNDYQRTTAEAKKGVPRATR